MPACPYCANPNLPEEALTPTPDDRIATRGSMPQSSDIWAADAYKGQPVRMLREKAIRRGAFTIQTVTDKDLAKRYAGFQVEIIGMDTDYDPPSPSGPFFHRTFGTRFKDDGLQTESFYKIHNACRITKKGSKMTVDVHWWPDHDFFFTIIGFDPAADFDSLALLQKLFKPETRGGVKVTEDRVRHIVSSLGPEATQIAAAQALNVSESALEYWRRKRGIKTWQDVIEQFT